jgi:hypothetical protein
MEDLRDPLQTGHDALVISWQHVLLWLIAVAAGAVVLLMIAVLVFREFCRRCRDTRRASDA